MRTVEKSVVMALDGKDIEIYPYLSYILQDFWEVGTDADVIINIIQQHYGEQLQNFKVLDLGSGKGAVSINIACKFGCSCYGIDALSDFVDFAISKALEYNVAHLCRFEVGDIRIAVETISGFDIIILGSIGQVFGNYYDTLKLLERCLNKNGAIIIADGYIDDNSNFKHPQILKRGEILEQISNSKMVIIGEKIIENRSECYNAEKEYADIECRCKELISLYPQKSYIFENYLLRQREENSVLASEVICSTMLIKRNY